MVVPAAAIETAIETETEDRAEPAAPEPPQAGLGRRLLALLVIVALIAIIIALVWWGLAR
jgi:uncharacterized membrane protein YdbT with pleckstrin-like domain